MSKVEIRGVIVPSNYDIDWMQQYIAKGIVSPESYIRNQIDEADHAQPLDVYINSPGGSVFAAFEVINALQAWKMANNQPVTITIGAMAASAASAIAILTGAQIKVFRNSKLMFHGAYTETIGGNGAHKDTADLLAKINADVKAALVGQYGIAPEVVDEWFAEGRAGWLSAQDAIDAGMASGLVDGDDEELDFVDADIAGIEANGLAIAAFAKTREVSAQIQPKAEDTDASGEPAAEPAKSDGDGVGESGADEVQPAEDKPAEETPATSTEEKPAEDAAAVADDVAFEVEVSRRVEVELNTRLAQHIAQITDLQNKCAAIEKARRDTQSNLDSAKAEHAKAVKQFEAHLAQAQEALKQSNARMVKYSLGSLSYSASIETWPEALAASNGDYATARKRFPDAYASYMNQAQKRK